MAVEKRIPGEKLIIGAIGRFHVQKGFDILVEAVRKAARPDLELHLYGDGPQRAELEALAQDCPSIVFKGFVRDTSSAMAACDVVAMPSRWEPYGLVAVEAMAARRAVVCSNADGLAGHIRTGAIEISDNTVSGWTNWCANIRPEDTTRNINRCWSYGCNAEARFSTSWVKLYHEMTKVEDATQLSLAA
ncbi:glycosyltransferase family 4 protein [Agrobacterium salinitolerans]